MSDMDLKKMKRSELLEILLRQNQEIDRLKLELAEARQMLADRRIEIEESGSIAEAALKLSGVFDAAQEACRQYVENIKARSEQQERLCREMEQQTKEKCDAMIADAKRQADEHWAQADSKIQQVIEETEGLKRLLAR